MASRLLRCTPSVPVLLLPWRGEAGFQVAATKRRRVPSHLRLGVPERLSCHLGCAWSADLDRAKKESTWIFEGHGNEGRQTSPLSRQVTPATETFSAQPAPVTTMQVHCVLSVQCLACYEGTLGYIEYLSSVIPTLSIPRCLVTSLT